MREWGLNFLNNNNLDWNFQLSSSIHIPSCTQQSYTQTYHHYFSKAPKTKQKSATDILYRRERRYKNSIWRRQNWFKQDWFYSDGHLNKFIAVKSFRLYKFNCKA